MWQVNVYASGSDLPATIIVTAADTCIVVDEVALASAAYPVTNVNVWLAESPALTSAYSFLLCSER